MSAEVNNSLVFSINHSFSSTLPFWCHNTIVIIKNLGLTKYIISLTTKDTAFTSTPKQTLRDIHCHQENGEEKQNGSLKNMTKLLSLVIIQDCIPCSSVFFYYIFGLMIFRLAFSFQTFCWRNAFKIFKIITQVQC